MGHSSLIAAGLLACLAIPLAGAVNPQQTVPSGATRPPVVLLNGWETGYTNACPVSRSSADTFGNLAQYLLSDGVPVVYFFDNCAKDPNQPIEVLANDLGKFLNSITFDDGTPVTQIDLVAHSMGGLIARAYLAGLQPNGSLNPPANTLVRDMVLIATPNFGSYVAGNNANIINAGSQSAELIPGSAFLWNLATWNQRIDDLRGVNTIAVIGNAGTYVNYQTAISLANAGDGIVSLTSASLGFVAQQASVTRIVPYCHVDSYVFTNLNLGYNCGAPGIANVTDTSQLTGRIVRSFLAGTPDWNSIGYTPATDPYLIQNGGTFFGMVNAAGSFYVNDLFQVMWGSLPLQNGGDTNTIFYNDFVAGTGDYQVSSQSLGTIDCGTVTEAIGYFAAARCKLATAIISVGPLVNGPARLVSAGSAITISGSSLGYQCNGCAVTATPAGAAAGQTLAVSSWTSTSITAQLPANLTGFLTIAVLEPNNGWNDSITVMVAPPASSPAVAVAPESLQFTATAGGDAPASQSIQITNSGTGTLAWTATTSTSWLSLSPASGTAPSTLSVSVSIAGLSAGAFTGAIQIGPVSVPVTLTLAAAPALAVTPQTLTFDYTFGGSVPAAQSVSITNTGGGTLSWTASTSAFWLGIASTSGAAPATLAVSVDPSNLAAGTYTGAVQIGAASVAVTLTVQGTPPPGTIAGIANGGSFQPGFASAGWVSIFGANLSQTTYTWQAGDFINGQLPTSLHGVSVTIDGVPAYVEYISPTQINVLAPDDAATGPVQVQVTTAGQPSNSLAAPKQPFAPAFFTVGGTAAAAVHTNYTPVNASQPAHPGEIVQIYGTGFGPTNPALPTSQLVTTAAVLANTVQFTIGGTAANVAWAGLVEAGLYQFNVTVPASLPNGDAQVVATVGGVQTQTGVSIAVRQ